MGEDSALLNFVFECGVGIFFCIIDICITIFKKEPPWLL